MSLLLVWFSSSLASAGSVQTEIFRASSPICLEGSKESTCQSATTSFFHTSHNNAHVARNREKWKSVFLLILLDFHTVLTYVASIVTPTPRGEIATMMACVICLVSLSRTCNRLEKRLAIRPNFLIPKIWPCCMYAIVTLPENGTIWCSHKEWISMLRTMTMSELPPSSEIPSPITLSTGWWLPLVKNCSAFAADRKSVV